MNVNQYFQHHLEFRKSTVSVSYCFTQEPDRRALEGKKLFMVIQLNREQIKIAKPGNILRQPQMVIEKIVEREVQTYLSGEYTLRDINLRA